MSDYTLEDLYQCSLDEYCEKMGTTPGELLDRKYRKIDILEEAYDKVIEKRKDMSFALLARAINEKIHSERKAIDRIEKWAKQSRNRK